ncbi:Mur ligase family protein [Natranaerobius trueperi]|uniref:UDP-N-acetylmuramyl peptide synthase n=1 Tax=Natranaerobius trueperi TaxID=759412 RepID=A0A226BXK1_9FIRM|nr:UDP-N-acetylmuramyl-tripeptide synthetase [Natranaerobius trueperi]OWZ82929.1 UDP-N-acetylmuramyl peptide synthase [Natranaerobius trueperi]
MQLQELIKNYSIKEIYHPNKTDVSIDFKISGLNYHSQKVSSNELFFCIKGVKFDGHNFAMDAYEKGAIALVVEKRLPNVPIAQIVVADTRLALSYLSSIFYSKPSKDLTMIGITSTNGKTTTSYMIDNILSSNHLTGLIGTVVVKTGDELEEAGLTTPESLDLQKYLYKMKLKNLPYCTMEVSSSGLELERVSAVDYDVAIINNIARDHIDLHGSFEKYFRAKKRLVEELTSNKIAILNVDCENTRKLINYTNARVITYSVKGNDAMVQVDDLDLSSGRGNFTINIKEALPTVLDKKVQQQHIKIQLNVLGLHNVYNATSAAIAALALDKSSATIQRELLRFGGVERRFQLIYNQEFKIIDDHFANSGNIAVTLETLRHMEYNKLKLLYAIRGGRGITVNRENVETLIKWANKLDLKEIYVTSSVECVDEKDKVSKEELDLTIDLLEEAGLQVIYYDNLDNSVKSVLQNLTTGDVLLFAGCQGMDPAAKIALNHLYNNLSSKEKEHKGEEVLAPLKNRIAGM